MPVDPAKIAPLDRLRPGDRPSEAHKIPGGCRYGCYTIVALVAGLLALVAWTLYMFGKSGGH